MRNEIPNALVLSRVMDRSPALIGAMKASPDEGQSHQEQGGVVKGIGGELFKKIGSQVQGAGTFRHPPPRSLPERLTGSLPPQAIPGPIRPEAANPAISWGESGRERAYP